MNEKNIKSVKIQCEQYPKFCDEKSCSKFPCPEVNELTNDYLIELHEKPYSLSDLSEWLKHDTWSVKEALLLLAGISPDSADIKWEGYENYLGVKVENVRIDNAQPLNEGTYFYNIPVSSIKKDTQHNWLNMANDGERKLIKLKELEKNLNRIKRLWESGQHPDERYPIEYYLNWAAEKKIIVPWFDWAQSNNLLQMIEKENQSYLANKNPLPETFIKDLFAADKKIHFLRSNMGNKLPEERVKEAIKRFVAGQYGFVEKELITKDWWDESNGLKYARQEVFLKVDQKHRIKVNKTSLYRVYMALLMAKPSPPFKWSKF